MSGPTDPTNEFSEILQDASTPALLRRALEMFMAADPKLARDAVDKLDELCERRLAMLEPRVKRPIPQVLARIVPSWTIVVTP